MDEQILKDIVRRLQNLETHVINFILPIQEISRLLGDRNMLNDLVKITSQPIKLDHRSLNDLLSDFRQSMQDFSSKIKLHDMTHTLGEIKFIGKRLYEIEKSLEDIQERGIKSNLSISVMDNGYELKRKYKEEKMEENASSDQEINLRMLLHSIFPREGVAIISRYGLFGQKKNTLDEVGLILNVSGERARQIIKKAQRKLRHAVRKNLVEKITDKALIKEILGE